MTDTNISDEAVQEATGRDWQSWFATLDEWGAVDRQHKAIAAHLRDAHDLSAWWSQMVCVQYERERGLREVGEASGGFQLGAQKTFLPSQQAAWELLTSRAGLDIWLGPQSPSELAEGQLFELASGTRVEVRVVDPGEYLRLWWHAPQWPERTVVLVRANESGSGRGTIAFGHEKLPSQQARQQMREHWKSVLDRLAEL